MSVDAYWDNFDDGSLGDWVMQYDPRLRRTIRVWKNPPLTKPAVRPHWVGTPQPATDTTVATPPIINVPILPPGTVMSQTTYDKTLEFLKYQIAQKAEVEKAKAAAGIAPGTVPTQAQQSAMMQNLQSNSVGSQTGGALDGAIKWIGDNILIVGAGVVIVGLVFMNPPGTGKKS